MKIFVFTNIMGNYCSGDYYFVAENKQKAIALANKKAEEHNQKVNNNTNYTIEWDNEEIKEFDLKPGYLPLNRIQIEVEK